MAKLEVNFAGVEFKRCQRAVVSEWGSQIEITKDNFNAVKLYYWYKGR